MKKRFLTAFAVLALGIIVGCGQQEKPQQARVTATPTDAPVVTATPTSAAKLEEIPVTPTPTSTSTPRPTNTQAPKIEVSLKDVFGAHGMKCGTCVTVQMISNSRFNNFILEHFNSVTMENSMKPDYIFNKAKSRETGNLVVEFNADCLKILQWAKDNGLGVRGHTLVWHSQTPEWIFHEDFDTNKELVSREVMLDRLDTYFKGVFSLLHEKGFDEIIYAYDIANECWMEDGSMRQSNWLKTIGEDYLIETFKCARKYAPSGIELYYNDYNEQYKTGTLKKFVETLKDEEGNYLIDGLGFQAHLYTNDSLDAYFRTIDSLAVLGLKIELTELDVCLGRYQGYLAATDKNLRTQGQFYYNLINGIFERVDNGTLNSDALTFWGFSDRMSWRKEGNPLLVDGSLVPKYAFFGAAQMREKAGFEE